MNLTDTGWIKLPNEYESGYVVQDFIVGKINHAEITVCGLGFFRLYVNGKLVSKELNNSVWPNYEARKLNQKVCKGMLLLTATLKTKDGYVKVVYADKDGRVSAEVTSRNVRISGKRIFDYSF